MKYRWIILSLVFLAMGMFFSCEEEKVERTDPAKRYNESFYNLMEDMYLWYQHIPDVDPQDYDDVQALLEAIRYEEDRWSYISSYQAFVQYYQEGAYVGYGFGYKWDETDSLRLTFVFDESPLQDAGITRSWAITKINGDEVAPSQDISEKLGADEPGVENRFEFKGPQGQIVDTTFAKKELTMNTVLEDTVIDHNSSRVGYFVLKSFINKTPNELATVFDRFASENIDELVVDLRYNGGGTLKGSRFLGEFIVNDEYENEPYVKISHNDKQTQRDTTHVFGKDSLDISLGLDRVYFITTQATASASEALINGLEPYMDTYLIGGDTYGKPVGMNAYRSNDYEYVFVPVTFSLENAEGVANYYDGLPVDVSARDGVTELFGSPQEASLHQALYHIANGSFDQTKAGYPAIPANRVEYRSLEDEIGAE
ncbi:MAG: hypothetical protein KGY60_10420 [Bacteroidales bacterium]|nr:hypothetical protein [Bacteroidales bacterium]